MKDETKMVKLRLRYVIEDVDRHGNVRTYFRRKGQPKIRLPGLPGSKQFMDAYQKALGGEMLPASETATPRKPALHGSFCWLCEQYFKSAEFKQLNPRTKRIRRNILNRVCERHGSKPFKAVEPRHIYRLRDELSDRPEAANALLKTLRQTFAYGVALGVVTHNPAREVPYIRRASEGFHTWTPDEINKYEQHHPIGSQARLAMALLYFLGQRRSDVVLFGRQSMRDGAFIFTQFKNRSRKRIEMHIPIHPELQRAIEATPKSQMQFIVSQRGSPFKAESFGNKFREWCDQAGLPNCTSHGLRKAAAVKLAEVGCTEEEIKAITGHRTSKEVSRYTRAASQKVLSDRAMARWSASSVGQNENESVPLSEPVGKSGTLLERKTLKS